MDVHVTEARAGVYDLAIEDERKGENCDSPVSYSKSLSLSKESLQAEEIL